MTHVDYPGMIGHRFVDSYGHLYEWRDVTPFWQRLANLLGLSWTRTVKPVCLERLGKDEADRQWAGMVRLC